MDKAKQKELEKDIEAILGEPCNFVVFPNNSNSGVDSMVFTAASGSVCIDYDIYTGEVNYQICPNLDGEIVIDTVEVHIDSVLMYVANIYSNLTKFLNNLDISDFYSRENEKLKDSSESESITITPDSTEVICQFIAEQEKQLTKLRNLLNLNQDYIEELKGR